MKANIMKMSVLATVLILLSAGASWADNQKKRHYNKVENKRIRSEYRDSRDYGKRPHFNRGRYDHPRRQFKIHNDRHLIAHKDGNHAVKYRHRYQRPFDKHYRYSDKRRHYHYYKHKPTYNIFSFRVPDFDPGWSVIIKSKSRW